MPTLTISIPSYNRNKQLNKTLNSLLPQMTRDCHLTIIDNCSDEPIAETSRDILACFRDNNCKVIRNQANIGISANVLRCIEFCETDWLWILGDDDLAALDAVHAIFDAIRRHPDATYLSFARKDFSSHRECQAYGAAGLLRLGIPLRHFLFISTSIYSTNKLRSHLRFGYMLTPTLAPHLGMLFMALGASGLSYISSTLLIDYERPGTDQVWSSLTLGQNMWLLLNLPLEKEAAKLLRAKRSELMSPIPFLLASLHEGLKRSDGLGAAKNFAAFLVQTQPWWSLMFHSMFLPGFADCRLSIRVIKALARAFVNKDLKSYDFVVDNNRQ